MGIASAEEALQLLEPRRPRGIWPHAPHPTQQAFLLLDDFQEAFYGGAAGGGKSDALLMAASQFIDHPHYRALILRRTFPELSMPGAIMDRGKDWWAGKGATWNGDEHQLTFASGARIVFAHAQYEDDVRRFAGTEFHAILFDELTRFSERMYRFLFSRLRKNEGDPIPLRMRGASNPGDIGHEWVKSWFVDPGAANRPFIPARLRDNPSVDQVTYLANLQMLHPLERQRLIDGDWDASAVGAFFRREWFTVRDISPMVLTKATRYWDLAATPPNGSNDPDWTVGVKMATADDGRFWILDVRRLRGSPHDVEATILQTAAVDGPGTRVVIEQEPGASGKHLIAYYTRILAGYPIRGEPSVGNKKVRAAPFASQAEAGNVMLVNGPWVGAFLDEAEMFSGEDGIHDDQIDAATGAFKSLLGVAKASQTEYAAQYKAPVVRRGDLVLVGERYVDKVVGGSRNG